jgi:hypothetical protein|uniref:hypothetical protein n=1 Tax=Cephaloticoccus sp. TaxID=1985742 RepID=UPI0040499B4C
MNKKTKTMFIVLPGCFGAGVTMFSSYELNHNSDDETHPIADIKAKPLTVPEQTNGYRNWTQTVVRLPEALHRSVWLPLTRRVQKLGTAA